MLIDALRGACSGLNATTPAARGLRRALLGDALGIPSPGSFGITVIAGGRTITALLRAGRQIKAGGFYLRSLQSLRSAGRRRRAATPGTGSGLGSLDRPVPLLSALLGSGGLRLSVHDLVPLIIPLVLAGLLTGRLLRRRRLSTIRVIGVVSVVSVAGAAGIGSAAARSTGRRSIGFRYSAVTNGGDELALAHAGDALEPHGPGERLELGQAHSRKRGLGAGGLGHECPNGVVALHEGKRSTGGLPPEHSRGGSCTAGI